MLRTIFIVGKDYFISGKDYYKMAKNQTFFMFAQTCSLEECHLCTYCLIMLTFTHRKQVLREHLLWKFQVNWSFCSRIYRVKTVQKWPNWLKKTIYLTSLWFCRHQWTDQPTKINQSKKKMHFTALKVGL